MTSAAVTGSPTHAHCWPPPALMCGCGCPRWPHRCATGHRCISTGARCTGRPMWCCWRTMTTVMGSWCSWCSMLRSVRCGDRFIARDSAATHTLGGGLVLDPDPPQRRRRSPARLAWLGALEQLAAGAGIGPLLQQAPFGVGRAAALLPRAADRIVLPAGAQRVITREDTVVILASHWQLLREQVVTSLRSWHERRPTNPVSTAACSAAPCPRCSEPLECAAAGPAGRRQCATRGCLVAPARP